jgi:hypothetical protein
VTDTPPPADDDLLASADPAPQARQHRSHRSHHRRRGLRPLDIAGIVVAVLVVIAVVVVIAKGRSSSSSAASSTASTLPPVTTPGGQTTPTVATPGNGPNATTWTFTTLSGKPLQVVKADGGSRRFAVYQGNSLPLAVISVQKSLAKNDCAAVQKLYTADATANPKSTANSNDRSSAYAHYALVQAQAKGCAWAKSITPPTTA